MGAADAAPVRDDSIGNRLAVLVARFVPTDRSGDHDFGAGITEDVITELSRFRDILVIGRADARPDDPVRLALDLGARYVLEGTVRRAGGQIRITAQLIEAPTAARLWSDRFDAFADDVLWMTAEVASRVVGSAIPELMQAEQRRAERLPALGLTAYEMALKAGNMISQGIAAHEIDVLGGGIELAQAAVAADPGCLRAHYVLAYGYCRRGTLGYLGATAQADLDRAMHVALRLRETEPRSHNAYAVMGHIDMRLLRHAEALHNLSQANELNPNDVTTLRWLSWEKSNHGLPAEARQHAEWAIRLSPRDRYLDQSYWALALACYVAGDISSCVPLVRRAIALNRNFGGHYVLLAASLAETGQMAEASSVAAHLYRSFPGLLESRLAGRTYFVAPELVARYQHALSRAAGKLQAPSLHPVGGTLSMREREVLRLVARGLSNAAAATALDLSEHTVKRHVANILTKLDLPTRAAAVAHASRAGLL